MADASGVSGLVAGDRVGRYAIEELIGQGGMGAVYRAHDEVLRRKVALKLVTTDGPTGTQGGEVARRVLREARLVAALDHPNVIGVFDVGEHDGTPFIVMEHVVGRSLRSFVGAAGIESARKIGWIVDIAGALAAAHRAGLVHRDVKPENVMVRDDGAIRVLDFGIAGPVAGIVATQLDAALLSSPAGTFATLERGVVAGTPGYMAPEVAAAGVIGPAADQFAWGVLAYELLTGRHPWPEAASVRELFEQMQRRDAEPMSPDVAPGPVVASITRALGRDPARRFGSMDELQVALGVTPRLMPHVSVAPPGAAVSDLAPTLDATASTRRAATPPSALRRFALAAAAGATVAGALLAFAFWRAHPPRFEARNARRLAFGSAYGEYPSFSPDGKLVVYDAGEDGENQIYLYDVETSTRRALTAGTGWHYAARISPSGKEVAYLSSNEAVVAPLDGSRPARVVAPAGVRPFWTRRGESLWAGASTRPRRINVETLTVEREITPLEGDYQSVAEFDDGGLVAVAIDETSTPIGLAYHPPGGGAPRWLLKGGMNDVVAVIPRTRWVLASRTTDAGTKELWQIPLGPGDARRVTAPEIAPTFGAAVAPDGKQFVWSNAEASDSLLELKGNGDSEMLTGVQIGGHHRWRDFDVRTVPGSPLLLTVSDREGRGWHAWLVDPTERTRAQRVATPGALSSFPGVSRDGRWMAFTPVGGGLSVTRIDGSEPPRVLIPRATVAEPAFSRDGRQIYFERRENGTVSIHRIAFAGGEPEVVLEREAAYPQLSPTADTMVYFNEDHDNLSTLMELDLVTHERRSVSPTMPRARYFGARFKRDGTRVLVNTGHVALDIDVASGAIVHRLDAGANEITGMDYSGTDFIASERVWEGDVWIAEGQFR